VAREIGDLYVLEVMLLNLGSAALLAEQAAEAEPLLAQAITIAQRIDDRVAQSYLLAAIGCNAALTGDAWRAANLLGAAETVRTEAGANFMPLITAQWSRAEQAAIAGLGASGFKEAFDAGKGLGREPAIRLALGESPDQAADPDTDSASSADVDSGPLGKREAEVARLIAEGLTNKQIATRLFISERTVDSHVRNILNKLGFRTRTQIATWLVAPPAQNTTSQR
jgi:DNA-binding CsgD family transcriptional regulator